MSEARGEARGEPHGDLRADPRGDLPGSIEAAREALFDALERAPYAFDFFALLRQVEALFPRAPRLGAAPRPSLEPLRLGQEPELDFAPAALESFDRSRPVPRLGVRFFGLFGPNGPMPLHFTEHVRDRLRHHNDPTLLAFLDVFHHRMLALLYRAWAQAQPVVQQDRPGEDRFAVWLGATFGMAAAPVATAALSRNARLQQAGLLATRSRHPEGLVKLLSRHFAVPVHIEEHVPQWLAIDAQDRSRLGSTRAGAAPGVRLGVAGPNGAVLGLGGAPAAPRAADPAGTPAQLGVSAVAGWRVWDRQFKFRIVMGPLTLAQYLGLQPGGAAWRELCAWVHQYVGLDLVWDVSLCLARGALPEPQVGADRTAAAGLPGAPAVQLGRTAWLGRRQRDRIVRDRRDLCLSSNATAPRAAAAVSRARGAAGATTGVQHG